MKGKLSTIALASIVLCTPITNSFAQEKKYDPGVTDKTIKIGNTTPYSGPLAVFGNIAKIAGEYFKLTNESGGVNGRQIEFISRDDSYSPAKAVPQTRRLVQSDQVFIMFSGMGTAVNLATRDFLNRAKVPSLFILSGNSALNNAKKTPYIVPIVNSYKAEGKAYAELIKKQVPDPKIAVLYQNDDFGKDMLAGLKEGLGPDAKKLIVAQESYEATSPSVDSQIINLQKSGANVFANFATIRAAAQAIKKTGELKWKPKIIVPAISASIPFMLTPAGAENSKGVITLIQLKPVDDPKFANDADVIAYKKFAKKVAPDEIADNLFILAGYSAAYSLVDILKTAGDDVSRDNILKIATEGQYEFPLLLPGIKVTTSPDNYKAFSGGQPVEFDGKKWKFIGDVIDY